MKGFVGLMALVALLLSAFAWWQVRSLREDFTRLEKNVQEQQKGGMADLLLFQAKAALAKTSEAISRMDMEQARTTLDDARRKLSDAARTAGQTAAPYVKRLEEEASNLNRRLQDRLRSNR